MIESTLAMISGCSLQVPLGHIYSLPKDSIPSQYDIGPWKFIENICKSRNYDNVGLVDIGANIGDSIAYFRSFSAAKAIAIEASPLFCEILGKNTSVLGDVHVVDALFVPEGLFKAGNPKPSVRFESGIQTGSTTADSTKLYEGNTITLSQIERDAVIPSIFKTDTDGFDVKILFALASELANRLRSHYPIIFAEGPSQEQMLSSEDVHEYIQACRKILEHGYKVAIFSNNGTIVCECGSDPDLVTTALLGLQDSFLNCRPYAHYYDFIFYV